MTEIKLLSEKKMNDINDVSLDIKTFDEVVFHEIGICNNMLERCFEKSFMNTANTIICFSELTREQDEHNYGGIRCLLEVIAMPENKVVVILF